MIIKKKSFFIPVISDSKDKNIYSYILLKQLVSNYIPDIFEPKFYNVY